MVKATVTRDFLDFEDFHKFSAGKNLKTEQKLTKLNYKDFYLISLIIPKRMATVTLKKLSFYILPRWPKTLPPGLRTMMYPLNRYVLAVALC